MSSTRSSITSLDVPVMIVLPAWTSPPLITPGRAQPIDFDQAISSLQRQADILAVPREEVCHRSADSPQHVGACAIAEKLHVPSLPPQVLAHLQVTSADRSFRRRREGAAPAVRGRTGSPPGAASALRVLFNSLSCSPLQPSAAESDNAFRSGDAPSAAGDQRHHLERIPPSIASSVNLSDPLSISIDSCWRVAAAGAPLTGFTHPMPMGHPRMPAWWFAARSYQPARQCREVWQVGSGRAPRVTSVRSGSWSRTKVQAFLTLSYVECSNRSTAWSSPGAERPVAPAWDWPLRSRSRKHMGGWSRWQTDRKGDFVRSSRCRGERAAGGPQQP